MEEAALRIELENELKAKKQCTYQPYECTQLCLDSYKFCSKHILQDKNARYKQCSFIYSSNGKRCNLPAPRSEKKDYGYCSEHALKATLARNRQSAKHPLPCTAEVLLHSLSHYVKKPRIRNSSSSTQHSDDGDRTSPDAEQKSAKFLDPFVDFDATSLYNDKCSTILDVCSESESDIEASTFSSVWQDAQADSSDDESIDSEHEDVLKHANVYTAEEVTVMTKEKLIRLQALYIDQYRHLQYLLTKKRRTYLHSLKREKETCCNIYGQLRDNPKEQRLYKKLKALNNYQKCHGVDAILSKRSRDLRFKLSDGSVKSQVYSKCIFTEGGVKCGERSLPLAKHCQKHILEDPNQVLFRACGKVTADVECPTAIAAIFDDSTCPLHLEIPFLKSYGQVRKDSESDADEPSDARLSFQQTPTQISDNIKTEFMNYIPPEIPKMESLPSMLFEESPENISEITNNSLMFNMSFANTSELKNEKLLEESIKDEDNKMEVCTSFVDNEVKDEKMDVNEYSVEVTKEDIDVTGTADVDVAEENVEITQEDIDVNGNSDVDVAEENIEVTKEDIDVIGNAEVVVAEGNVEVAREDIDVTRHADVDFAAENAAAPREDLNVTGNADVVVAEENVEVTREDIDVTGNAGVDFAAENAAVTREDIDVTENTDVVVAEENVEVASEDIYVTGNADVDIAKENIAVTREDIDVTRNADLDITEGNVENSYNVVGEAHSVEDSCMTIESEFRRTRVEDHSLDMRDTAVDALLKAAEMINVQDNINKINAEKPISLADNGAKADVSQVDKTEITHTN